MKALGKALHITAEGSTPGNPCSAALTLGVDSDSVRLRTFYRELKDCRASSAGGGGGGGGGGGSSNGGTAHAACILSIKDFARTLRGIATIGATVAVQAKLAIVPGTALFLHVELEDGTGSLTVIHTIMDTGLAEQEQEGQEQELEQAAEDAAAAQEEE